MINYHRDNGPPRCALKVDIKKAYDTISWSCILDILSSMGTPTYLLRCIKACITTLSFSISVNGELAGFFAIKRGLRQGDPLSSFLFIITMEAFSRSLSVAANRQEFQFHPKCGEINLTHLCFANDMFLFSGGTNSNVQVIMDELNRFESFSGLQVNKLKSTIFLAEVNDEVRNVLLNTTRFSLGSFPMKYLGVPLISTRLSHSDCQPLLDKIMAKLQSWTSRSLSYAGRLQLISSVLYSIQMYWCSMFIIPKLTISKIEQTLRSFLWSGNLGNSHRVKIKWGSLGLHRVKDLNDANIMKHICNLFYRKDSLWVAWVQRLYLKQGSLWCAKVPSKCSWSWRKLLQVRDRIRPLIKHKVGNGAGTFLWHDFWNPVGPLLPTYGQRIIYDYAIHSNAHGAAVINNGEWNWPIANSTDLMDIKNSCINYQLDVSKEDIISWTLDPSEAFTVSSAWNHFRRKMPVVSWHHKIWFPQAISRHAFIVWLSIQDRLATQDKLFKWGLTNSVSCVFSRASVEDRNHLFFGCQFTAGIWLRILKLCGISRMPRNWENDFLWVIATKGKSFCSITKTIAWGATLYHLWSHRNSSIHENIFSPADAIFHLICNDVRLRISRIHKVVDNPVNRSMCERWSFPFNILAPGRSTSRLVIGGPLPLCGPCSVGSVVALPWLRDEFGWFFLCPGCGLVFLFVLFCLSRAMGFIFRD